jgi:hypothetical protein
MSSFRKLKIYWLNVFHRPWSNERLTCKCSNHPNEKASTLLTIHECLKVSFERFSCLPISRGHPYVSHAQNKALVPSATVCIIALSVL